MENHMRVHLFWLVLALTLCVNISSNAQNYSPPSGELYQIREAKMAYFDSIRGTMPDSVFYSEGGEYAEFQKWFSYWEVRAPEGNPSLYDQMIKSYCDLKFHSNSSFKSNNDPWLEIGPKGITNNMFGIGPIRHIAISKTDPEHMLCTSNSGGLFYTTDANASCTWINAGTDLGLPYSGCKWADYYPGSIDKWYTLSTYGRIAYVGGLYRRNTITSEWEHIADQSDLMGPGTEVHQFIFDRSLNNQNDHRMFLMTSAGLFVTDEPEATDPSWNEIDIAVPPSVAMYWNTSNVTGDPNVLVYDMEYLSSSSPTSTLCAAMQFTGTYLDANNITIRQNIWRFMLSTDNGASWTEVPNQAAIDPTWEWATVETSAASPSAFHCMVEKGNNSSVKLYETTNQSWSTLASSFNPGFGAGHTFGIDQFIPTSLIVGSGVDVNWYLNGVEQEFQYPSGPNTPRQYWNSSTGHDDVEDIVGDPEQPGIFWVANHGGVSRVNTNVTPRTFEYKCEGLGVAEVWSMSTSQEKPDFVALALNHQCHVSTRSPYDQPWQPDWSYLNEYGDGTLVIIDHKNANTVYQAVQDGRWARNDNAETSDDATTNWSVDDKFFARGSLNRKFNEYLYNSALAPITGTTNPDTEIEIQRSFNKGQTRVMVSNFKDDFEINHPTNNNDEKFMWMHSDPSNSDNLYVGLQNWDWQQRIYRNTNINHPHVPTVQNSWEQVPHPRRAPLFSQDDTREPIVVDLAFDLLDENRIYIAYAHSRSLDPLGYLGPYANKMVFRLDVSDISSYPQTGKFDCDGTLPCWDITMNLPNTLTDHDCLEYEQGSDGGLYIATEAGVYYTNNKRISAFDPSDPEDADDLANSSGWVRLGGALPHISSTGLEINYQINRIRVGTTGRGAWEHGLHCPPDLDIVASGITASDLFHEAQATIASTAIIPPNQNVNYRAGISVHLAPDFHANEGSHFHAFIHPCDIPGNSFDPKSATASGSAISELSETTDPTGLRLFPNPTNGFLNIELIGSLIDEHSSISVFDSVGKLAFETAMKGNRYAFDSSGIPPGIYMVSVVNRGNVHSHRFVVQ